MSFESYGQNETLISSIRNIIKDYPFGSIIKEFLQNADDAGATRFHVILDERSHPTEDLFSDEMKAWQGPAILIFNDAKFKDSDFVSLMQIRVGGKQDDTAMIGKHGIGFNSCYHFTDVPSFVSDGKIAFLDPQERFLPRDSNGQSQRGIIGPISTNGIGRYPGKDQFVPFEGIEGLDFQSSYDGTIFRIPFRRVASEISDSIFTTEDVLRLITDIKSCIKSQLLFLRNIEAVEMSRIREATAPHNKILLWKATINGLDENIRNQRKCVNNDVFNTFQIKVELVDDSNNRQNDHWIITTGAERNPEDPQLISYANRYRLRVLGGVAALLNRVGNLSDRQNDYWTIITGALRNVESRELRYISSLRDRTNASNFTGRMYSFFQLPDVTNLPVHLNGTWAQGSDRGRLLIDKDDLPDLDREKLNWNRHILLNFLPKLYCKLLKDVIELKMNERMNLESHPIKMLWPFPPPTRNYPKYAIEYGCKVLQLILQNEDIIRLINNDCSSDETSYIENFFSLLECSQISDFRELLRNNWNELNIRSDPSLRSMISSLPIWPTVKISPEILTPLIPASCGHILTIFVDILQYYRTRNSINFLDSINPNDFQIFHDLNVPSMSIYSYIFEHVDFPSESDEQYIKFLISIISLNDQRILGWLRERNCFPTLTNRLRRITDLYDHDNDFFRNVLGENSNIFLHHKLSKHANILSTIGLKNNVDQVTFINCAGRIEELQNELNTPYDLRYRGSYMANHLYRNIDALGSQILETVTRIQFVPVSKDLDRPYSLYYRRPILDCFRNIILFRYKEVAWSQASLIAEDVVPPQHILQNYPWLFKPSASTVIRHLRFLYETVRNDDEWKNNWGETFKHNVYEVYKWLEKECLLDEDLVLSRFIHSREPLFLNFNKNQDPFDADNWMPITRLVLNTEPSEERYVNPSLANYRIMLKRAGANEIRPPNFRINVREHDRSYVNATFNFLLDQEFPLNDITFIIRGERIKASQYILASRSRYFCQEFTSGRFAESNRINPATITIDDVEPRSMRILLRYLYGQSIDDAIQNRQSLDNNSEHERNLSDTDQSSHLELYKDLLKLSDRFELGHLKEMMELRLSRSINRLNVEEMKTFARTTRAAQLETFCEHFIRDNRDL